MNTRKYIFSAGHLNYQSYNLSYSFEAVQICHLNHPKYFGHIWCDMPELSARHCWLVFAIFIHLVNWPLVWSPWCDMPELSARYCWLVFAIFIHLVNWPLVWSPWCDIPELSARHCWLVCSIFIDLVNWPLAWSPLCDMLELSARHCWPIFNIPSWLLNSHLPAIVSIKLMCQAHFTIPIQAFLPLSVFSELDSM